MIDNIDIIKPLLSFDDEGDFYMLYIFVRKKDQTTDKANHQSVRTIKSYCIDSTEHLEKRYDEIKKLAEMFRARVYIHIQKQNHKDVAMDMIVAIADRIKSGQINQKYVFDSVVGSVKAREKRWIVDVDVDKFNGSNAEMAFYINVHCMPFYQRKIISVVPTPNGVHLITKGFDVAKFKERYPYIEIHKKNPTLLYYPESLNESGEG
jgi:hypothetical protein